MAVGVNLNYKARENLWNLVIKAFTGKRHTVVHNQKVCSKAGVPANNTAADMPNALGDMCYDTTNDDVYICTVFTLPTTCTWVKIAG